MIRAGKLVYPIEIERVTTTADDAGVPVETWAPIASVRAEMVERTIAEAQADSGTRSETNITFRIRYVAEVALADRVTYAGKAFDLIEIEEPQRGRELVLKVRRIGP